MDLAHTNIASPMKLLATRADVDNVSIQPEKAVDKYASGPPAMSRLVIHIRNPMASVVETAITRKKARIMPYAM